MKYFNFPIIIIYMFYFKYQLTIELIPYVEIEVNDFLQHSRKVLQREPAHAHTILKCLHKKLRQIDHFYEKHYLDYRTHFILTSRKLLTDFMKQHIYLLKPDTFQQDDNRSEEEEMKGGGEPEAEEKPK